jgi:hypothetical protein
MLLFVNADKDFWGLILVSNTDKVNFRPNFLFCDL